MLSKNVCKGVSENLAEVQPLAFTCSFLTMLILISTDLQLLTYIHVWNTDRNLFFILL